jgi:hypothetical protein
MVGNGALAVMTAKADSTAAAGGEEESPPASPGGCSVCDLYRRRWDIEVFFKQVKQSLKLSGFLGHSANAVRWQVYAALLVYVLLRYMAHLSDWGHSFTRLFAVTRSALWERLNLLALLKSHGTASGRMRVIGALDQAWLPGFASIRA